MSRLAKVKSVLYGLVFYLIPGFSAPFIFRSIPNHDVAALVAGFLFALAGVWSIALAIRGRYPKGVVLFFCIVLLLEAQFWIWRGGYVVTSEELLGFDRFQWHRILTSLYLIVGGVLIFFQWQKGTESKRLSQPIK